MVGALGREEGFEIVVRGPWDVAQDVRIRLVHQMFHVRNAVTDAIWEIIDLEVP